MPSVHALLSASSAHRWIECTPSARLEETITSRTSSYAQEGTLAHSICEALLTNNSEVPIPLDNEMRECCEAYKDFVEEELNAAKAETPDARLFVEHQLSFDGYVPEGFGTSDAVIVSDTTLEVIDFKYGKGVPVNAKENPQLRLYALGAYLSFDGIYDFKTVKTVVFQPRLGSVSSETLTLEELLNWADNTVKPQAELAFKGEGNYVTGEHCRFCKAAATCRARVTEAFEVINHQGSEPALISDDEIPDILDKIDNAEKWITSVRAYALEKAINGKKWRGYKIVEGRSVRKIDNQLMALTRLEQSGYDHEAVTNTKLKSITDLEKLIGKKQFAEILGDLIVKPKGEPVLAKESDKREEISIIGELFKED